MKNFAVTYRGKDGKQESIQIAANDRQGVFDELAKRGISAIRVQETNGKVKPRKASHKGGSKPSGVFKGALAGIIVVAVAVAAFWLLTNDKPAPEEPKEKKSSKIVEVTPAPSTPVETNAVETPPPKTGKNGFVPATPDPRLKTYRDERGILRYEGGLRVPGQRPTAEPIVLGSHQPKIFKHSAEEHISWLLEMKVGEPVIGDMAYGDAFLKSFKESLDEPIEILDTDDEATRDLKQAVIETKKELKERMDAGEDIAQIMTDTRNEFQRLGRFKHELQMQLHEIRNDTENYSDQDVEDFVSAANMMLKDHGIPPIKMGRAIMRGLKKNR